MERDFAALGERERITLCLELAQSASERASSCRNSATKELLLSLAQCWRSMAKQFEALAFLNAELQHTGRVGEVLTVPEPQIADFDLRAPLKTFAT